MIFDGTTTDQGLRDAPLSNARQMAGRSRQTQQAVQATGALLRWLAATSNVFPRGKADSLRLF